MSDREQSLEKALAILRVVIDRTAADRAEWAAADASGVFILPLDNGAIRLKKVLMGVAFEVLGADGTRLHTLMSAGGQILGTPQGIVARPGDPWSKELDALYEKVERKVSQVDEKLDAILRELEG